MTFRFTQEVARREFPNGESDPTMTGPTIRFTVEVDGDFPISPDVLSTELGHFVMRLLAPGQSCSVKSTVDPWPLPPDWSGRT